MKNIKKLVIITLIIVSGIILYYRYANKDEIQNVSSNPDVNAPSEAEQILSKNLDEKYPATPLEVVKFFTRIQKCYYNEDNSDIIIQGLSQQAKKLMDEELIANNPDDEYFDKLNNEIDEYGNDKKRIGNIIFDKSSDIMYSTIDGVKAAALNCTYYIQSGSKTNTITEVYILRKNDDNQWKIYGWMAKQPPYFEE